MLERVLTSDYVESILRTITNLPLQFARQSAYTMRWMFHESQWALESLYSLFSVAQITASQLQSIQQSLHALDSAACPSCGHIYALLHCLLFSVLLDAPLLDSTLHPFSYDSPSSFSATFLPLLTHLSTAEPSTLSFALGLALLRDDSSSTCVLAVSSGLSAHELHRIHRSIAALGFLDLPPCARSRCLSLLYRALIVFIERYVLASCPLASLKSLREQYAHLAVAPPASAFPDGFPASSGTACAKALFIPIIIISQNFPFVNRLKEKFR